MMNRKRVTVGQRSSRGSHLWLSSKDGQEQTQLTTKEGLAPPSFLHSSWSTHTRRRLDSIWERYRVTFEMNMIKHVQNLRETHCKPVILMGDLNVAPTINDVWDDSFNPQRRKWPGCKPWERRLFQNLRNRTSLIDGYLHFAGGEEKGSRYTFWRKAQDRQEQKG